MAPRREKTGVTDRIIKSHNTTTTTRSYYVYERGSYSNTTPSAVRGVMSTPRTKRPLAGNPGSARPAWDLGASIQHGRVYDDNTYTVHAATSRSLSSDDMESALHMDHVVIIPVIALSAFLIAFCLKCSDWVKEDVYFSDFKEDAKYMGPQKNVAHGLFHMTARLLPMTRILQSPPIPAPLLPKENNGASQAFTPRETKIEKNLLNGRTQKEIGGVNKVIVSNGRTQRQNGIKNDKGVNSNSGAAARQKTQLRRELLCTRSGHSGRGQKIKRINETLMMNSRHPKERRKGETRSKTTEECVVEIRANLLSDISSEVKKVDMFTQTDLEDGTQKCRHCQSVVEKKESRAYNAVNSTPSSKPAAAALVLSV